MDKTRIQIHEFLYLIANCEDRLQSINQLPRSRSTTRKRNGRITYDIDFDVSKSRQPDDMLNAHLDTKVNYTNVLYYNEGKVERLRANRAKFQTKFKTVFRMFDAKKISRSPNIIKRNNHRSNSNLLRGGHSERSLYNP